MASARVRLDWANAGVRARLAWANRRLAWGNRRRRGKRDAVAAELDAEFLALGCSLVELDCVGDDVPDRLVGFQGRQVLVEYKSPGGKLSDGQREFAERWRGGPVYEVRTRDGVRAVVASLRG